MFELFHDIYKTLSCYKTIRKVNNFVHTNKEKINNEELEVINENKYISHTLAFLTALGIQTSFYKLKRFKFFAFRPFLPSFLGVITSCSFLYLHTLYLSRNTISKLIQLNLKKINEEGICIYVDEIYKKEEPDDYIYLKNKVF
ncbi:conserved Plasmodium protein, unknown function [Plasmodium gallinaceum]|uniref:Transmembrane protein n=1 Tax=Plasmodium gallinaceum TaxID=5849 RepID=A0A1J1H2W2_PLAGA|nr:conserved Plasmodium protein, unknown function [Plasmodium gallinaceum]CRG97678.1 conserved Plasmodium protein, unknown function [Plasmodium gallinaceum]